MPLNKGLYRAVSKWCIFDQPIESLAEAYKRHFETATGFITQTIKLLTWHAKKHEGHGTFLKLLAGDQTGRLGTKEKSHAP
jgi:hypothetical protein